MKSDDKHDKVAETGVQRLNKSIEINISSGFRKSFQIFPVPASISRHHPTPHSSFLSLHIFTGSNHLGVGQDTFQS